MVQQADTVANPRAVVIHAENALTTYVAVVGARRLNLVALLAILEAV